MPIQSENASLLDVQVTSKYIIISFCEDISSLDLNLDIEAPSVFNTIKHNADIIHSMYTQNFPVYIETSIDNLFPQAKQCFLFDSYLKSNNILHPSLYLMTSHY